MREYPGFPEQKMSIPEKYRKWCIEHREDKEAQTQFVIWFQENERRKLAYFQANIENAEPFLSQEILTLPDLKNFFNYLDQQTIISSKKEDIPVSSSQGDTLILPPEKNALIPVKKIIGSYEILEKIGEGGMGIVFKVRHRELHSIYAMKLISSGKETSEEDIQRFRQEAQIMAKLKHPGIVQVIDFREEGGQYYLIMELLEGTTLDERIKQKISIRKGVEILKKVLEAMQYAHSQGVIHRDIKPENIFVTASGEAKIGDFGLAKTRTLDSASQKLTKTGALIGTPEYMSPEQLSGNPKELNAKTDIYSTGVCLYQLLTSHCPFESKSLQQLLYQILYEDPALPSKLNPKVHADLDTIVFKALEKTKLKRYTRASDFAEDLGRFLEGYPILAKPPKFQERLWKWCKRNKAVALFFGTLLMMIFGFLGWLQYFSIREKEDRYLNAIENAKNTRENANKINAIEEKERTLKMTYLLEAISYLNMALSLHPQEKPLERTKLEIINTLLPLMYQGEQYQLANYVVTEMKLSIVSPQEKEEKLQQIEMKRTKTLREHQKQLEYWTERLNSPDLEEGEQEDAIFIISRMPEKEILDQLVILLNKGNNYFLTSKERKSKTDSFYETIAEILGRLANPEAAKAIDECLKQMEAKIKKAEEEKQSRSISDEKYLEKLAQAIGNSRNKDYLKSLLELRMSMGESFWSKIQGAYEKLSQTEE